MEAWKDIEDFTGLYQVSNFGRVRSLDRIVPSRWSKKGRFFPGKLLSPGSTSSGYAQVVLCKNGDKRQYLIHRLVCAAFHGNSDLQVNHKNGIKNDNRPCNLEWCTGSENQIHSRRVLGNKCGYYKDAFTW